MIVQFEPEDFASYLRLCMSADGIAVKDLAAALKMSAEKVTHWRGGRSRPRAGRMYEIDQAIPSMDLDVAIELWTLGE